jgi:hypothetical protein
MTPRFSAVKPVADCIADDPPVPTVATPIIAEKDVQGSRRE